MVIKSRTWFWLLRCSMPWKRAQGYRVNVSAVRGMRVLGLVVLDM
jgi:hypothetical protein